MRTAISFGRWSAVIAVVGSAVFAFTTGCANPVVSDAIDALGPEPGPYGPGPYHRGGQPCLLCHDGSLAGAFSVAGTIYSTETEKIPVNEVTVLLTDAAGHQVKKTTNCAGNFYITGDTVLEFPLRAEITCTFPDGSQHRSVMGTRIDRDGSCAGCHTGSPSGSSPGRVACAQEEPNPAFTKPACSGNGR